MGLQKKSVMDVDDVTEQSGSGDVTTHFFLLYFSI